MATKQTNKTIVIVGVVGILAFLTWKLWPVLGKKLLGNPAPASGSGSGDGYSGYSDSPDYYPYGQQQNPLAGLLQALGGLLKGSGSSGGGSKGGGSGSGQGGGSGSGSGSGSGDDDSADNGYGFGEFANPYAYGSDGGTTEFDDAFDYNDLGYSDDSGIGAPNYLVNPYPSNPDYDLSGDPFVGDGSNLDLSGGDLGGGLDAGGDYGLLSADGGDGFGDSGGGDDDSGGDFDS